jgi:hypothetical protein
MSIMTEVNMMLKLQVLHTANTHISGHSSHACRLQSVSMGYLRTLLQKYNGAIASRTETRGESMRRRLSQQSAEDQMQTQF